MLQSVAVTRFSTWAVVAGRPLPGWPHGHRGKDLRHLFIFGECRCREQDEPPEDSLGPSRNSAWVGCAISIPREEVRSLHGSGNPLLLVPDLNANVREILRVIKPGGAFLLIAEAYRGDKYAQVRQRLEKLQGAMNYTLLSAGEHRDLFSNSSYSDVRVFEEYEKG